MRVLPLAFVAVVVSAGCIAVSDETPAVAGTLAAPMEMVVPGNATLGILLTGTLPTDAWRLTMSGGDSAERTGTIEDLGANLIVPVDHFGNVSWEFVVSRDGEHLLTLDATTRLILEAYEVSSTAFAGDCLGPCATPEGCHALPRAVGPNCRTVALNASFAEAPWRLTLNLGPGGWFLLDSCEAGATVLEEGTFSPEQIMREYYGTLSPEARCMMIYSDAGYTNYTFIVGPAG